MKKLSLATSAVALSLTALVATPLPLLAQSASSNLTTVNGKPVPKARAEALLQQAVRQGKPRSPALEAEVRDEVVLREMFVQEAVKRGLPLTDEYKTQIEIARQGILIRELFMDYQKKNPVTEAEIQAEYDKYKEQVGGNEFHARHILVEKEELAKSLISQLKGGAKFEELAKKHSKDEGSAANGGDLDWASPGTYVPEFAEALGKLGKGEVTPAPVKTEYGYHVIRLDDTRASQPVALDKLRPQISQHLNQAKLIKFRDDIKARAKTDYKFSSPSN